MRQYNIQEIYNQLVKAGMPPIPGLEFQELVITTHEALYTCTINQVPADYIVEPLLEIQTLKWICGLLFKTDSDDDVGHALVHEVAFGDEMLGGYHDEGMTEDGPTPVFVATGGPSGLYAIIKLYTALDYESGSRWLHHGVYLDSIWSECGILDASIQLMKYINDNRLIVYTGATDKVRKTRQ